MARKPDTPCSSCGKALWSGTGSRPAGKRLCRACRRTRREAADQAPCVECGGAYVAVWHGGKRRTTCSDACASAHAVGTLAAAREVLRVAASRDNRDDPTPIPSTVERGEGEGEPLT